MASVKKNRNKGKPITEKQSKLNESIENETGKEKEKREKECLINYTIWDRVISMLRRLRTQKMSRITFLLETNWNIN